MTAITGERTTARTYAGAGSKLPRDIALVRVVAPEGTVAIVSDELDPEERTVARAIASYLATHDVPEGTVRPFVLIRLSEVMGALAEATRPTLPFPGSEAPDAQ